MTHEWFGRMIMRWPMGGGATPSTCLIQPCSSESFASSKHVISRPFSRMDLFCVGARSRCSKSFS